MVQSVVVVFILLTSLHSFLHSNDICDNWKVQLIKQIVLFYYTLIQIKELITKQFWLLYKVKWNILRQTKINSVINYMKLYDMAEIHDEWICISSSHGLYRSFLSPLPHI